MIKKILLCLTIASLLSARCLEGCLRCSEDNKCLYCNVLKGYQLRSERCIKPQIPNCILTNENSQCLKCKDSYYLDTTLNRCAQLLTQTIVENCDYHVGPHDCATCDKGFYLKNGACNQISSPIENCQVENEWGICEECVIGFVRSIDKKSCVAKTTIFGCGTQKQVTCRNCKSGYFMNENYYLELLYSFKTKRELEDLTVMRYAFKNSIVDAPFQPTCQKLEVTNCEVYRNAQICARCISGYLVNAQGKCEVNPKQVINNCLRYSSLSVCVTCSDGFRLESSNCVEVHDIDDCLRYQPDSLTTVCLQCHDDYYLSAKNMCTRRTELSKIDLCENLSPNFEKCLSCLKGYTPTSDGYRCLALIDDCGEHNVSNRQTVQLTCKMCKLGYYYEPVENVCIEGTVQFCEQYELNDDQCAFCKPKFYLVDNQCLPQSQIQSCLQYHPMLKNSCVQCDQNNFLFERRHSCQKVERIPKCKKYENKTSCAECDYGYQLRNKAECIPIPMTENCLQKDGMDCVKCLPHFALMSGRCYKGYDWVVKGCNKNNLNGETPLDQLTCQTCKTNFLPIEVKDTYLCKEENILHQMINVNKEQNFDPDCLQYTIDNLNKEFDCVRCRNDRVLVDGECRENCSQNDKRTVYKQWVEFNNLDGNPQNDSVQIQYINICETTIPNCAVASIDVAQDFETIKYSCQKCVEGYLPVIDIKNYGQVSKNIDGEKQLNSHMPRTSGPGVRCVEVENNKMVGNMTPRSFVDQCEYYFPLNSQQFGCRKCLHGKTGVVIQVIKNCQVYENWDSCKKCEQGFFLASPSECRPIVVQPLCKFYDPESNSVDCTECNQDYYLQGGQCIQRVLSVGKLNCVLDLQNDNCVCNASHVQDPNTKNCLQKPEYCLTATVLNQQVNCTTCDRSVAYQNGTLCKIGTVTNCVKFNLTLDKCDECDNGFYLENELCKPHTAGLDSYCQDWNITNKNQCQICDKDSTKFIKTNQCQSVVDPIDECAEYSDLFSCSKCNQGYYLNNVSKRCLAIPADSHCKEMRVVDLLNTGEFDSSDYTEKVRYLHTCDQCEINYYRRQYSIKENYLLNANSNTETINLFHCVSYLDYHLENCDVNNSQIDGKENFGKFCYGCDTQSIPLSLKEKYVCVNKNYLKERKHGFEIDQNCVAYEYTATRAMECTSCKYPYFLDSSKKTCVDGTTTACTTGKPFVLYITDDGKMKKNTCQTPRTTITGCNYYVTGVSLLTTTSVYTYTSGCFDCSISTNYYPQILDTAANTLTYTFINALDQELDMDIDNQSYPLLTCLDNTTPDPIIGLFNGDKKIPNCAVYKIGTSEVGCARCKQRYRGRITIDQSAGFIEFCELMTTCSNTKAMAGLGLNYKFSETYDHLMSLFSCQQCTDNTKIPVIFVDQSSTLNINSDILAYFNHHASKDGTNTLETIGGTAVNQATQNWNSYQTDCWTASDIENTADGTSNLVKVDTALIPAGCGMVIVDVSAAKNGVTCVACKEGYYPDTYDGTVLWMVTSCTIITGCTSSGKSINSCGSCIQKYDEVTQTIDITAPNTNCIGQKGSTNCYAGIDNGGTIECKICDSGYELADDFTCYHIEVPQCEAGYENFSNFMNQNLVALKNRQEMYSNLQYENLLPGCNKCSSDDYILYQVNSELDSNMKDYYCAQINDGTKAFSAALRTTMIGNDTDLSNIADCTRYGHLGGQFICVECSANFILHQEKGTCSAVTNTNTDLHPFCLIAKSDSSTDCEVCQANYTNIGGLCRVDTDSDYVDPNCQTPAEAQKKSYQSICAKCNSTYYAKVTTSPFNRCTLIPATETNCVDYLDETGCVKCEDGYGLMLVKQIYLQKTKRICVKMDNTTANSFDHDANCQALKIIAESNSLNQQRIVCRQCKADSVLTDQNIGYQQKCYPIVPLKANCKTIDKPSSSLDILATQLGEIKTKDFKCLDCTDEEQFYLDQVTDSCLSRTAIAGCGEYDKYADLCKECDDGFFLTVDRTSCDSYKTNKNPGYLDICRDIEKCQNKIWYEGLNAQFSSIYSCHKCQEDGQIPFAIGVLELDEFTVGFEKFTGTKQFDSDFIPYRTTDIQGQQQIQCIKPEAVNFNVAALNFNFPTNCALGFVNLQNLLTPVANVYNSHDATMSSGNVAFDIDQSTIRCSACNPGYSPSRQEFTLNGKIQELGFMVTGCTAITNCESSTWFNACSQCDPGYAHTYTENGVQFDTCTLLPSHQKACWAYETNTTRCRLCRKGAYLNKDYVCEEINPPNCEAKNFRFNHIVRERDIHNGLYFSDGFVGCNQCKKGFVGVKIVEPTSICVESQYHVSNSLISDTFYVNKCVEYGMMEGRIQCKKCTDGYVKSRKEDFCFIDTNIKNCEEASSLTLCKRCVPTYVLVDGQCQLPLIENCIDYGNSRDNLKCDFCGKNEQICQRCKSEYYLEANECKMGKVINCDILETDKICLECKQNHTLVQASEGTSYCYPNDPRLNCREFKRDHFQAQVLECEECVDETFVKSLSMTDRPYETCMQFSYTERCVEYKNNPIAIGGSNFQCKLCQINSYLKEGLCIFRTVQPDECLRYNTTSDTCLECEEGYFITPSGTECVAYPQGILGCESYFTQHTCQKCMPDYYLNDEQCHPVENLLENCIYYEDDGVCQTCAVTFLNIRGNCFEALAQNCLTYENLNACNTCVSGFNLQETDGLIHCVQTTIVNCQTVDIIAPYDCIQCLGNFYPNGQECMAITAVIEDCLEYDTSATCSLCSSLTILTTERNLCLKTPEAISHIDLNCEDNILNENPVCNTCKPGYTFLYGECIGCPGDMILKGCYTCDPKKTERCLMCRSGWIQTPEGLCRKKLVDSKGIDETGRSLREFDLDD